MFIHSQEIHYNVGRYQASLLPPTVTYTHTPTDSVGFWLCKDHKEQFILYNHPIFINYALQSFYG